MISRSTFFVSEETFSEVNGRTRDTTGDSIDIWMVDDNDNFRSLLAELLAYEEDLVCSRQFPSAEAVLEALINETPPDVILLDIRMRGRSGLDAVRPIKSVAGSTTVLMLTTFFDSHARARAIHDGAADLLLKSYTVDEIAHRIRQAHSQRGGPSPKSLETESIGGMSSDWQNNCAEELKTERCNNDERIQSHREKNSRDPSRRHASSRLARGVNYLRTLLMTGRRSRQSAAVSDTLAATREIGCVSE